MIPYTEVLAPTPANNPDKLDIQNKKTINVLLNLADVSASGFLPRLQTTYDGQEIVVYDDDATETVGDIYYTPFYKEKISYNEWKTTINKSFEELGNE